MSNDPSNYKCWNVDNSFFLVQLSNRGYASEYMQLISMLQQNARTVACHDCIRLMVVSS